MSRESVKRFLFAPLDWGLGHTTRCVPLIRHLHDKGHEVIVAGNAQQRSFLKTYFPEMEQWDLEGYNVRYSSTQSAFLFTLLSQVPRLLSVIRNEKNWLLEQMEKHPVDGIISDNRYGLFHPEIPCAIITHQLQINTGMGTFADELLRSQHYSFLERFQQIWVADVAGTPNLSGRLGHPGVLSAKAKYLGLLSQFELNESIKTGEEHLLILLSGPEPQRGMLSKLLWGQAVELNRKIVFVEGSDEVEEREDIPAHIQYYKRLGQAALQPLIEKATMVVCRSGYSTLMDLVALNKKAILIATPGQTEQEYLAKHLHQAGVFYCTQQKGLELAAALKAAEEFPYKKLLSGNAHDLYKGVLDEWVTGL